MGGILELFLNHLEKAQTVSLLWKMRRDLG